MNRWMVRELKGTKVHEQMDGQGAEGSQGATQNNQIVDQGAEGN